MLRNNIISGWLMSLICFVFTLSTNAQSSVNGNVTHDGVSRNYLLYIPASYDGNTPVPLVMNFHGYTSSAFEQMFYGDFRSIADTAGFLIVHPNGLTDQAGNTHWNVGWGGSTVDDIGFVDTLLDVLSANYNIDADRIYSTGMSNGGFMSFHLACNLSHRIAAIASVTGSMSPATLQNCGFTHPMPVMQIHGTSDATVPYNGGAIFEPIDEVIDYWTMSNLTDLTPTTFTTLPDIDPNDGSTVEHEVYENGLSCVSVEHYRVLGGGHSWPGASIDIGGTNYDFDASKVIWEFFSQYDLNGEIGCPVAIEEIPTRTITAYPNPAQDQITVEFENISNSSYQVYHIDGTMVEAGSVSGSRITLSLDGWAPGIYVLSADGVNIKLIKN